LRRDGVEAVLHQRVAHELFAQRFERVGQRLDGGMIGAAGFAFFKLVDVAGGGAPFVGERAGIGAASVGRTVPHEAQE